MMDIQQSAIPELELFQLRHFSCQRRKELHQKRFPKELNQAHRHQRLACNSHPEESRRRVNGCRGVDSRPLAASNLLKLSYSLVIGNFPLHCGPTPDPLI